MRDRLIELLKKADKYASGVCTDYDEAQAVCAEYLISEGVIVPPCKVGDTIYFVSRGEIIPMVVNCISFNGNYQYCLNCNYADEEQYGYSLLTFTDKVRGYMFGFTKEEAEKALKERSNENG